MSPHYRKNPKICNWENHVWRRLEKFKNSLKPPELPNYGGGARGWGYAAKPLARKSRVKCSGITRGGGARGWLMQQSCSAEGHRSRRSAPKGTLVSAKRNAARSRVKCSGITRGGGEGTEADGALINLNALTTWSVLYLKGLKECRSFNW
jgi:hypothetical protein